MGYVIACIVGFVAAGALMLMLMSLIPSLGEHVAIAIVLFLLCWGAMIGVCKYVWWIGIILAVVAGVVYIIKKKKPLNMEQDMNATMQQENDDKTEE